MKKEKILEVLVSILFVVFLFIKPEAVYSQSKKLSDVYETSKRAVFLIESLDANGNVLNIGTGFFISQNGIALTNYHVLEGAADARINLYDGKVYWLDKIIGFNKKSDLVKFSLKNPKKRQFNYLRKDPNPPKIAQSILVIGNPKGFENSLSAGLISGLRKDEGNVELIQITAPISAGNSGSPLINMEGKFLGVISFTIENSQSINFAISINELLKLQNSLSGELKDLKENQIKFSNNSEHETFHKFSFVELKKAISTCENCNYVKFYTGQSSGYSKLKAQMLNAKEKSWSFASIYIKDPSNRDVLVSIGTNHELQSKGKISLNVMLIGPNSDDQEIVYSGVLLKRFDFKNDSGIGESLEVPFKNGLIRIRFINSSIFTTVVIEEPKEEPLFYMVDNYEFEK